MKKPLKILPDTIRPPVEAMDLVEEITHPEQAKKHFLIYIRDEVLVLNFYRIHMLYFIITILIASVILYGEGLADDPTQISGNKLRYIDALFLGCSSMTTTGLSTVNLGDLTGFQQAVLVVLLIAGNVTFVSTFVVLIRQYFFRQKLADIVAGSRAARKVVDDLEQQELAEKEGQESSDRRSNGSASGELRNPISNQKSENTTRRRRVASSKQNHEQGSRSQLRSHHQMGLGTFPAPWDFPGFRSAVSYPFRMLSPSQGQKEHKYVSFNAKFDDRGRFRDLNETQRSELGGVEYRALGVLLYILSTYQIFWISLGSILLIPYSYRRDIVAILHTSQPGNLNPGWFAFFSVIASYTNGGLNPLNANFVPLQNKYFILIVAGTLTIVGNTQFPILLRFTIWVLSKLVRDKSRFHQTLTFLLAHPRRCFIYLFPSKETWNLLFIQAAIDLSVWVLYEVLNIGNAAVESTATNVRIFDGLFQATGLRTSGSYIITISSLAPALLVIYLVVMYVSSYPIVMALRQTNTYEERSIGIDDTNTGGGLAMHLRRQLAYDLWFQLLAWFLICIIERSKIVDVENTSFNTFAILFEVTSAYGTVGLSTGLSYDDYSLSGAFQSLSKVVMLAVMLRGRHRGLPLAIDRSILVPGEHLMHEMDKHYNHFGYDSARDEEELRREEKMSGVNGKAVTEEDGKEDIGPQGDGISVVRGSDDGSDKLKSS